MRDQSAGPVLVRRRSDSNGTSDINQDMSDLELDNPTDEVLDDPPYPASIRDRNNALGIHLNGRPSNASSRFEGGIAPAVSAILQTGTWCTKYAQKGKKRFRIWLDPNSARVCWHPTNLAKSFFIDDVTELRIGAECRNALDGAQVPEEHEDRAISIVYNPPDQSKTRSRKVMHLVMDSDMVLSYWTDALNTVTRERTEVMNALTLSTERSERSMAMIWRLALNRKGPDGQQLFTLDDARWFCRKLEINCSDHAVRTHFARSDTSRTGLLDYEQYRDFVNSFKERKDIQYLYQNINLGTQLDMDLKSFLTFLEKDQHVEVEKDRAYWEGVFDRFAKPTPNKPASSDAPPIPGQRVLNMQNFQNFLTSAYNSPLAPSKGEVTLDRPLNEYFISSSHNTYLLGRQVAGLSSVEGYIVALIKGCRCIEIDCWDGEGGRPMVTHGRTMTSKVSFEDCISTIGKYAFHSSPYPLVVSLEVHCNALQQKTMVELMTSYWKGYLVTEPVTTDAVTLPSPEELKHRIIVKVKTTEDIDQSQLLADASNGRSRARSLGSAFVRTPSVDKQSFTSPPFITSVPATSPSETNLGSVSTPRGSTTSGPTMSPSSTTDDSDDVTVPIEKPKKQRTSNIIPELGRLGVYAQGIKFRSFLLPESKTMNHIFSFAENKFDKLCTKRTDSKALLETHNLRHLMRVYPWSRRVDSSNFDPLRMWRRGVQMAALNWQTYDVHQQVNEAMFAAGSDRLGYVLKPDELRPAKHTPIADTIPEAAEKRDKKGKKFVKFTVDILSAQRLPRPRNQNADAGMNPYIEFEMLTADDKARGVARGEGGTDASARDGSSGIGSPVRKRTKIVEGNGFDPIWNEKLTLSAHTKYPALIFVRWTVWNSPEARHGASANASLATFTAKLAALQQGYRHLPLFNPHGEQYRDAKLWVRITKDAPIALQPVDEGYAFVGPVEAGVGVGPGSGSPRTEAGRGAVDAQQQPPPPPPQQQQRSWSRRIFSRVPSERKRREQVLLQQQQEKGEDGSGGVPGPGPLSRTSSLDRESLR